MQLIKDNANHLQLLSMGDEPGWVWHAAGSARMLYKVGPENVLSEFHMSLLASQCRIMVRVLPKAGKRNSPQGAKLTDIMIDRWSRPSSRTSLVTSQIPVGKKQYDGQPFPIAKILPTGLQ